MQKRVLILTAVMVGFVLVGKASEVSACDKIVAFGDSLSDNGPADGYGFGVWTNGEVWLEYLADEMYAELEDRALGGAKTSGHEQGYDIYGLDWQVETYLDELPQGANLRDTLFVVWAGGNDFLFMEPGADPGVVIRDAVENIRLAVESLVNAGARNVLVMNLPNLGVAPFFSGDPAAAAGASYLAQTFNALLKQDMCSFTELYRRVHFHMVDTYALLDYVVANKELFGFMNVTGYGDETNDWDGYLFWDPIHPTTATHEIVAAAASGQVRPWWLSWETQRLLRKLKPLHPRLPFELECRFDRN